MTDFDPLAEFDRQLQTLLRNDYPALAHISRDAFVDQAGELRRCLPPVGPAPTPSSAPFVLVTSTELVPPHASMPTTALLPGPRARTAARPGTITMFTPEEIAAFHPIPSVQIPAGSFYLALDLQRGEEFCNWRPEDATAEILRRGRTPLTIAEGIAHITALPATLEKNKCMSLAGSRTTGQKVPALWISERAPKLGWCWDRNPHSWLGVPSCAGRLGMPAAS